MTDDPTIDFTNKSLLFNDEDKKYGPKLSLEVPTNKLRIQPKLRPNKYPFEVKEERIFSHDPNYDKLRIIC